MSDIQDSASNRMKKSIANLQEELNAIRTGRASAAIFDKVRVNYYGTPTPLNQVSTISIPEARSVLIQPFDKTLISEIEKGIQTADLGLNPSNDGKVVRISIPALTADRRKELVKQAKNIAEQSRIAIRNIRRDANDELKKQEKNSEITEDQLKVFEEHIQKSTDNYIAEINKILEAKEKDILEG
ncbi:MAG: ribosome recycling factor [Treponema sp. CETP13]|nr:MAG: ribosome recycling factor [Treponema sp. CETP13]